MTGPITVLLTATDGSTSTITVPQPAPPIRWTTEDIMPGLALSSFQTGALTDDQLLAAAASYIGAQTFKGQRIILDQPRDYTFNNKITGWNGAAIVGAGGSVDQDRSGLPIPQRVKLRMAGGWFVPPNGTWFGAYFDSLSLNGVAGTRLIDINTSSVVWTAIFRDLAMDGLSSMFGSSTTAQPMDACTIDGWHNWSNNQDTVINWAGSDNSIAASRLLIDTPTSLFGPTGYMMKFTASSKTPVTNLYLTCDQHSGILVSGGNQWMNFTSCIIEGRNTNTPCYGALIRVTGSEVSFTDCWTSFAMSNPAGSGHGDLGVIHVDSGVVNITGCTYQRAASVAESVPYIYVGGGHVTVRGVNRSGSWVGKPVVRWLGGTLDADDTVTVVTT